jgi:prepilin-type N-terminal cleavage/methylation domain-containing protein
MRKTPIIKPGSHRLGHCRGFTLLEVVIAMAILALSMGAAFSAAAQANHALLRATEHWQAAHALDLATEYYMLCPPRQLQVPGDLLPEGLSAQCEVQPISQDLPEFAAQPINGWVLVSYHISIHRGDGMEVAAHDVHKLIPEEDL